MSASAPAPSRLPIKITGSSGPGPPLPDEPVTDLTRVVRGEEPVALEPAETEEPVPPPAWDARG